MSASYDPPFSVPKVNAAARNAIPAAARREGMTVYLESDQITYQLRPAPWAFDDNDWFVSSALEPYTIPIFTSFSIAGVGTLQVDGAAISGAKTFNWSTSPSVNVAATSIVIADVTTSTTLASSLADDGTQSITLPVTITLHTGDSHAWSVSGLDGKGNAFSREYTVACVAASDNTYYVRSDGSDTNAGTANSSGGAWLTTQRSVLSIGVGDTVNVGSGTFVGFVLGWDAPQNGASGHPIWYKGASTTINHRNNRTQDAIDTEACSFIKISGFTVTNDGTVGRAGIRMSGGGNGNEISGNTVTGSGRFGIITGYLSAFNINDNTISGVLAGGGQATGHAIYASSAGDVGSISRNTISGCAADGIHTNGDVTQGGAGIQTNITIERNSIGQPNALQSGGGINCDGIVDSVIRNNLIYSANSTGIALYSQDASGDGILRPSVGNVVINNTVILSASSPRHCLRLANGSAANVVFNNVLYTPSATSCSICCDADSIPVSDYNLVVDRFSMDGGTTIISLAQWRLATGNDLSSTLITSLAAVFNSPTTDDYTLKNGGPAINAGVATFGGESAPADDLIGASRPFSTAHDIGAYESHVTTVVVTSKTPAASSTGAATTVNVTMTFDRAVSSGTIVFALANSLGADVPGSLSYDSGTHVATFDPTSALTDHETYTATLSAVTGVDAVTLNSPVVWTFTVGTLPVLNILGNVTPGTVDAGDGSSLTFGLRFRSSVGGQVVGVRFYKAAGNTGTHTGYLWSVNQTTGAFGSLLATKTFSGESASGWQEQLFDTPIAINADVTYKIGVHMPAGHYSFANHYFLSDVTSGVLTAPANNDTSAQLRNCTFVSGNAYPTGGVSGAANNYFVDVMFQATG